MPRQIQLSIVIPTHETRELVLRCLESIEENAEGVPDLEIIVVDDGSSDGSSEEVQRRYPKVKLLRHEEAQGFSRAATFGLDEARGDFLLLLNSDTRLAPGSLKHLVEHLSCHDELRILGAQLLNPDGSFQWSGGLFPSPLWLFALVSGLGPLRAALVGGTRGSDAEERGVIRRDWVSGAAMAFQREVWEKVGPFDDGFEFYAQDLDFCFRAGTLGISSCLLPGFRVFHEHGGTVRRKKGAVASVEPEKLWPDLLRFVERSQTPIQVQRSRRLMCLGARLRLGARFLRSVGKHGESALAWTSDTERFRRAAARLSRDAASS